MNIAGKRALVLGGSRAIGRAIARILADRGARLILPWFDYGKSYRPVIEAIAKALPEDHDCLAERGLNDTQRASLAYFVGIEPLAADSAAAGSAASCAASSRS